MENSYLPEVYTEGKVIITSVGPAFPMMCTELLGLLETESEIKASSAVPGALDQVVKLLDSLPM
jgi:hypothetical protein